MSELLARVLERDELADLDPAQRRLALRELVRDNRDTSEIPGAVEELAGWIDGFGPLSRFFEDDSVTDVLVNGPDEVWVESKGELRRTSASFGSAEELQSFAQRILGRAGARADVSDPIADARLPDGSRLHVVLPPVAPAGPLISIRRFPRRPKSMTDLIEAGMLNRESAQFLINSVRARVTMAISGPTGCGKTTLLNALLSEIDERERVVLIEETAELRPCAPHWVSLLTRAVNVEGVGRVTAADLVRASLRMRPDRIVVGEVRGAEALDALQAMSVGHSGSMLTVHSGSPKEVESRLVSLALMASSGASEDSLAARVASTFRLIVHLDRCKGRREVVEIVDMM
ncbi:MAG: Flp pilus assembly complex ATPase component TadA [Actinomycetota bacterium]|nr:Flp pilus assembly complex ATPase component TadA [Actinomycetota bacterium]